MSYLLLIRHGQNDWVNKKRLAGWTPDVHLNKEGQRQVECLAERLASVPLKAVYSSPLERCMETAIAVARPHKLEVVSNLEVGEVHYGKWEGKKIKKLAKKRAWYAVQHFPSRFRFPKGESLREVQFRTVTALEKISEGFPMEPVAVVSHADVIKLALSHYLGVHLDLFQRIALSPASVSIVALLPGGLVRVLRVNDDGTLHFPKDPQESKKSRTQGEDKPAKLPGNGRSVDENEIATDKEQ